MNSISIQVNDLKTDSVFPRFDRVARFAPPRKACRVARFGSPRKACRVARNEPPRKACRVARNEPPRMACPVIAEAFMA